VRLEWIPCDPSNVPFFQIRRTLSGYATPVTSDAVNGARKKTKKPKNKIASARSRRPSETAEVRGAIADRLAGARKAAGLSQIEVARQLERPRSWIGKLETARRSLLFSEALELADLYGAELGDLGPLTIKRT
jgi:ribosome-binding protein aMBF1 (putative translation factor)